MHPTHNPLRVLAHCARVLALSVAVLATCVGVLGVCAPAADAAIDPAAAPAVRAPQPVLDVAGHPRVQDQPGGPSTDPSADSTLPPGPRIEPEESEQATQDRAQTKAIVAAVAVGLLVIVIAGRKQRNKHKPGGRK